MQIEKFISQQIESQFPAIYKEDAQDLIAFVKSYYEFLETLPDQSTYNTRRLFEYRDIDSTLVSMLEFFKEKYLEDLNAAKPDTKFLIKNILDLYRRRGSQEGLELFFKMFYDEKIKIYYPSKDILRPSSSNWQTGDFIQLYPVDPSTLTSLANKLIFGSISKAQAIVSSVQFTISNSTLIPIIILNNVKGEFEPFDEIYSEDGTSTTTYGTIYGSLNSLEFTSNAIDKSGNKIGDVLIVEGDNGFGGKVSVTKVTSTFSGEVEYDIIEGGFGYTEEQARLIASDQFIYTPNSGRTFKVLERIEDQANNVGIVLGQTSVGIGISTEPGMEFTDSSIIYTVDRSPNVQIFFSGMTTKNTTSPGVLYPDAVSANTDTFGTVQAQIINPETNPFIEDEIGDYLLVPLNAVNFNIPPALQPMSGNTNPVNIDTVMDDAFLQIFITFGTIDNFTNILAGNSYLGDVFGFARDPYVEKLSLKNDFLFLNVPTTNFIVGEEITQGLKRGKILEKSGNYIKVLPYSYIGFSEGSISYSGNTYTVEWTEKDAEGLRYGRNAIVNAFTTFAVGKIEELKVVNSGIGYVKDQIVSLKSLSGEVISERKVKLSGQGVKEGSWKTYESHLNSKNGKVLQDSFFYQDYSYEIQSDLNINTYKETLLNVAHPAGVKLFGKFVLNESKKVDLNSILTITQGT